MLDDWQRLEYGGRAVYVNPEKPDWVVANGRADRLLQAIQAAGSIDEAVCAASRNAGEDGADLPANLVAAGRLCDRMSGSAPPYRGRLHALQAASDAGATGLRVLRECWFHLTNNCNLACRHCLFASRPGLETESLPADLLQQGLEQARRLGCRLFYFTGG